MSFISEGLSYLISAVVIIIGAYFVLGGKLSIGKLVAFTAYQQSFVGLIAGISSLAVSFASALAGLEQMFEVLDARSTVVERKDAIVPDARHARPRIVFRNIMFSYKDRIVLRNINLEIPPGQSVALVGPSGSGKTTLINLLLRFYDPGEGMVCLDGRDIREFTLAGYRKLFAVVLQDPFLFNDSIHDNLVLVKPDATQGELETALRQAQAWDFVQDLEGGMSFRVGESGRRLSGGQRQRIAIARCFLLDPKIIVLDEATSALDNQSEARIQEALQAIMSGRTTFVIAHRLSTVRAVNRILVLKNGEIVQDGSYDELSRVPGVFRELHLAALGKSCLGSA